MASSNTSTLTRTADLSYLATCIANNDCCSIVGVSNVGKSTLLRRMKDATALLKFVPNIDTDTFACFYIDFNLQLEMTGQGFYELVLRTILNKLQTLSPEADILAKIESAYQQVIAPTDDFQNALNFNQAIITLCENWDKRLVLLFDEFDELYQKLDARVFLNLRALRDRYPDRLIYVIGVGKTLLSLRNIPEVMEFAELFSSHSYTLRALNADDVTRVVRQFAQDNHVSFSDEDIDFITRQSGGHPGLLETVCQILAENTVAGVARDTRIVQSHLADNANLRIECVKLWQSLSLDSQNALLQFVQSGNPKNLSTKYLRQHGIIVENGNGHPIIFSQLFEEFIRRQNLVQNTDEKGIRIDVESGHVYVDGKIAEVLTKLEYRLLLLLYGNLDKICDKYTIVESVWGEDYIEEVDDARIEKLISRLRQKIEPNPAEPKYLITVRGRGYRLQN